jgi:phosphohistidine phosphatase
MRSLTLIRHAKAEPAHHGQEDWDRPLEPQGMRDATEMARRLKTSARKPDKMLASPAVRAVATATLMGRALRLSASNIVQDERLYLASSKAMLAVIHELGGGAKHLAVVGHNPGITELADQLSSERSVDHLPTCAVYRLDFDIDDWSELAWGIGMNAEFDYPKRSTYGDFQM